MKISPRMYTGDHQKQVNEQYLTWVFVIILISTLAWWGYASILAPIKNNHYQLQSFRLVDGNILTVRYPDIILIGQEANLEFTLEYLSPNSKQTNVQIFLPDNLTWVNTSHALRSKQITFLGSATVEKHVVTVVNSQSRYLGTKEFIWFQVNQHLNKPAYILVHSEGLIRSAAGRFGNTGNDGNSLFPLITILISIAGLAFQLYKNIKDEEKINREEAEKQEQQKLVKAQKALGDFFESIQKSEISDAQTRWKEILDNGYAKLYRKKDVEDSEALLSFAKGENSETFATLASSRPNEVAGVFRYAIKYFLQINPSSAFRMLRGYPIELITDTSLKSGIEKLRTQWLREEPSQPVNWPILPENIKIPPRPAKKYHNPFFDSRAENELKFLFSKSPGLFYEHQLFSALNYSSGMHLVSGETGSGKTALAYAIGKYKYSTNEISIVMRSWPTHQELFVRYANTIFEFIENHPTHLIKLGNDEKKLVAIWLASYLDKDGVIARLEPVYRKLEKASWLKNAKNEDEKYMWLAEASAQLQIFIETARSINLRRYSFAESFTLLQQFAQTLGFMKFRVVIDLPEENFSGSSQLLIEELLSESVDIFVFHPKEKRGKKQKPLKLGIQEFTLIWDTNELKKMVLHRWRNMGNPLNPDDKVFKNTNQNLDSILKQARGNPGRFSMLWQQALKP